MVFKDDTDQFFKDMKGHVADALNKTLFSMQRTAKQFWTGHRGTGMKAVDTGRLVNSVSVSNSETGPQEGQVTGTAKRGDGVNKPPKKENSIIGVLGTNVEYGPFVELGTHKMGPRAALRKANEIHKKDIFKFLEIRE